MAAEMIGHQTIGAPCSPACVKKLLFTPTEVLVDLKKTGEYSQLKALFVDATTATTDARVRICTDNKTITKHLNDKFLLWKGAIEGCKCDRKTAEQVNDQLPGEGSLAVSKGKWPLSSAFSVYTYRLMLAPAGGKEAARLFSQRSEASYGMKQYENALEDIERALTSPHTSEKEVGELLLRKGECLLKLGDFAALELLIRSQTTNGNGNTETPEGVRWSTLSQRMLSYPENTVKRGFDLGKFKESSMVRKALEGNTSFHSQGRFHWLNTKVDLIYKPKQGSPFSPTICSLLKDILSFSGFFLMANTNLEFGEIVAFAKPFASYMELSESLDRCHQCFLLFLSSPKECEESEDRLALHQVASGLQHRMPLPVPCPQCSTVVYCSEACRIEAWTAYHRFECHQQLALSQLTPGAQLALRMLYSAGSCQSVKSVMRNWRMTTDKCSLINGQTDYSLIFALRLPEVRNAREEICMTVTACFLAKLAQMSDFVSTGREYLRFASASSCFSFSVSL